jgi:hypothetical protein
MPMPTRRAVRPDSKHYRDSRRQRLARSLRRNMGMRGGKRGLWMALAAIFMIGVIITGTLTLGRHQTDHLETISFYLCLVVVIFSIVAALFTSR